MDLSEAAARLEIQQQLANYATGVDEQDWELYKSVFTADADVDYSNSLPLRGTPEEIVAFFEPVFGAMPWTQHYITNVSCRFEGDECQVRAFFHNPCRLQGVEGTSHHYGYYDHRFILTDAGWKSMHMVEVMLHRETVPPAPAKAAPEEKAPEEAAAVGG